MFGICQCLGKSQEAISCVHGTSSYAYNVCKLDHTAGNCLLTLQVLTVLTPDTCILVKAMQVYMAQIVDSKAGGLHHYSNTVHCLLPHVLSLTPFALQWADVMLVEGSPAEFDKLKQVRRQNAKPISLCLGSHTMLVQQKLGQGAFAGVYQVCLHCSVLRVHILAQSDSA